MAYIMELPTEVSEWLKEQKAQPLTRVEVEATTRLFEKCMEDEKFMEMMIAIRGTYPEWIIKHYFRAKNK